MPPVPIDIFSHSRTRIRWAEEYISDFKRERESFLHREPYTHVVEPDGQGVYEVHKVKLTETVPDALTKYTVAVVENLRATLDMVAFAIRSGDSDYFPFCRTAADMEARLGSACKDFAKEIRALFASFQPYKGGDDLLWALNELCKPFKHRVIVP